VLSRITTLLMLVSASIVSLALIGQFTRFDQRLSPSRWCCSACWCSSAR
jgi:hypothetical protein